MTRWAHALLGLCLVVPATAGAQVPTTPAPAAPVRATATARLTLAEALELGRRNSPAYRQFLNDHAGDLLASDSILLYGLSSLVERNETYETKRYCPGFITSPVTYTICLSRGRTMTMSRSPSR